MRPPYSTRTLLDALERDDFAFDVRTEHHAISPVFFTDYPATDLFVLGSDGPIDFEDMPSFFGQIEDIDATAEAAGIAMHEDWAPMWLYRNRPKQAPDPNNLVASPFVFEIGYPIQDPVEFKKRPSPHGGTYRIRRLQPLTVASVVYRGSYPHQDHSAFVDACQALLPAIERAGRRSAHTLYREIYHLTDWSQPTRSITEIQVELLPGG